MSYTMTHSLTGWQWVVMRGGPSPEGLPINVQVTARPWREDGALAAAQQIEQIQGLSAPAAACSGGLDCLGGACTAGLRAG
jgi:Asp-tRNA(Asn)/Glu-tRNA(Gln) amidotransferase A subunit family amidase